MSQNLKRKSKLNMYEQYPSCSLTVHLDDNYPFDQSQKYDFNEIRKRLKLVGGKIRLSGNVMEISFDTEDFVPSLTRNAGRKHKAIGKCVTNFGKENVVPIYYADLVYWHYGMNESWLKIAKRTNVSTASFYRYMKKHTESWAYKKYVESIDMNRVLDYKYLASLDHGMDLFY